MTASDHLKQATGSEGMEMKDELQKLKYEDSTQAESTAAEQWAVAYVAQVGATKETMVDALSTLRAVVMAYDRKLQNVPATGSLGGDQDEKAVQELIERNEFLEKELTERTKNADYLRSMVGSCHLMISRNDMEELRKEEWDPCSLPPRLDKFIDAILKDKEQIILAERRIGDACRADASRNGAALAQKTRECEELKRIPDDLQELYEAAKGVQGTGLPIPWAADRAIELIDRIARCRGERDMEWLSAFAQIDSYVAFAGDPRWYVQAVFEPCLKRANDESLLNCELRAQVEQLGRQVAEMSEGLTDEEWERINAAGKRHFGGIWRSDIEEVLASRARTK